MGIVVQTVNGVLDGSFVGVAQIEAITNIEQEQSTDALVVPIACPELKAFAKIQYSCHFHGYGRCSL